MDFSIITPSFRSGEQLKLCIESVADQREVELEHIIQDAESDDGTADWLPHDLRVKAYLEKDSGMYDAVNRGYARAKGDILAYLNCDEQYLPGALAHVHAFFKAQPRIEVLLAGAIIVNSRGDYVCHRRSLVPDSRYLWCRFPVLTCSIFVRRRVVHERGILFDPLWRDIGDVIWVQELLRQRVPLAVSSHLTSAFADSGANMGLQPNARRESAQFYAKAPKWMRILKPLWIAHHRFRRLAAGHFHERPTNYSIFTAASPDRRVVFHVEQPTGVWRSRLG